MSDDFDFDGTRSQSRRGSTMQLWDMLAILVLIITVCLAGYFIWIFLNPQILLQFPSLSVQQDPNSYSHTHQARAHLDGQPHARPDSQ